MALVKIKLTYRDEPFTVDESELPGLRSQGLIAKGAKPVPVKPVAAEPKEPDSGSGSDPDAAPGA